VGKLAHRARPRPRAPLGTRADLIRDRILTTPVMQGADGPRHDPRHRRLLFISCGRIIGAVDKGPPRWPMYVVRIVRTFRRDRAHGRIDTGPTPRRTTTS
jgi:hypothetical protein